MLFGRKVSGSATSRREAISKLPPRENCFSASSPTNVFLRVWGWVSGVRPQGVGLRGSVFGLLVSGLRFRNLDQGAGFRVQDSGFRVQGSGFRVQGPGFRILRLPVASVVLPGPGK